jgi:N6-adenosine-specific RNA methylase IME4
MSDLQINRVTRINQLHAEIGGYLKVTLEKAIEIGSLLSEQKAELFHGDWIPWVEANLNFDVRTAQRYIKVSRKAPELKYDSVSYLTEAYTRLSRRDEILDRQRQARELSEGNEDFPDGDKKYRVLYADPPWDYNTPRSSGDLRDHYPAMSNEALCNLPVMGIAEDNAVLFLWATSPKLMESRDIIESWGFTYKAAFIWDKVKHNFGHYNSVRHELLLICTRGSCTPDVKELHDSVVTIERTKIHSEKPEYFRQLIDKLYPSGRRIELFARGMAPGDWAVWGNEAIEIGSTA